MSVIIHANCELFRSQSNSRASEVVDKILRFLLFANTDVVHSEDHRVILRRILLVEDVLHGDTLPVVIVGADHAANEANGQV